MKRLIYLSMLCFIALSSGCSYNELPEDLDINLPIDNRISLNVETRAEVYNGIELDREYFVTASDLEKFVEFRCNTSKRSNFSVKEVKSYGFDSSQTLFYILNYNEGWEVVAADKRIQPTLAHGDSGAFTMDCDNEPMKFWMNMLADGVLQTRLRTAESMSTNTTVSTNSNSSITSSPEEQYVEFWGTLNITEEKTKVQKPGGIPIEIPDDMYRFRYLIDTEQETVNIDTGPLLETKWGQRAPWNTYCPLKTDGSNERAPAGCTAVAGAQLLYYFAHNLGWEIYAPTTATCSGYINNYSRQFDGLSYNAWGNMAQTISEPMVNTYTTAAFIAYVGSISEMDYGNDGSSASTADFNDAIEELYGITSTKSNLWDYEESIIINSISDGFPVFIWGAANIFGNHGHSWISDGYRREVVRTTNYYIRSITMLTQSFLETLDKTDANQTIVEDSLTAEYIHMNWGWNNPSLYNGWFSLLPDDWSPASNTYDVVMRMYYNFTQNN